MDEGGEDGNAARRRWMSLLAKAPAARLGALLDGLGELPRHRLLRRPETGLVMVRGRMGGTGGAFNLGEMTVTRCTVQLDSGTVGHGYVGGRDRAHAERAALADALLQEAGWHRRIAAAVLAPLADEAAARRGEAAERAAATRVEFFTVSRESGG